MLFKNTLTSEEGWAHLVQLVKPLFSWRCLNPCWFWLQGSGSLLFPSPSGEGLPYTEPWLCGFGDWRQHSKIRYAFPHFGDEHSGFQSINLPNLRGENYTFSVLAMLCMLLSVGVYINVLNSYLHSKEISRNHKYMYTYTYIKYIY